MIASNLRLPSFNRVFSSKTEPSINSTPYGIFSIKPVDKLSIVTTEFPSKTSRFAIAEPINPAAPVTRY